MAIDVRNLGVLIRRGNVCEDPVFDVWTIGRCELNDVGMLLVIGIVVVHLVDLEIEPHTPGEPPKASAESR